MKSNNAIYLHVGLAKTATTTIQRGLTKNDDLLAHKGWLYPKSGRTGIASIVQAHHNLVFEMVKPSRFSKEAGGAESVVEEIREYNKSDVIISSEAFGFQTEDIIRNTHKIFSSLGKVTIIVYIRSQEDWLYSLWSQRIKHAVVKLPFEEWLTLGCNQYDFYATINLWAAIFGQENIKVKILESQPGQEHVFIDFLRLCGVKEFADIVLPSSMNVSPSVKTLEVIRQYTLRLGLAPHSPDPGLTFFPGDVARWIGEYAAVNGWDETKDTLMSPETRLSIMKRYEESNRKLAMKYLGRDELFLNKTTDKPYGTFSIDDLKREEIIDLSAFVLSKINARYSQ